jgi:hypothetical protein
MYRRFALMLAAVIMLSSLSGCIIFPGHGHGGGHCCWRYDR